MFPTQVRLLFAATVFNLGDLVLNSLFQETSAFPLPGISTPSWRLPALGYPESFLSLKFSPLFLPLCLNSLTFSPKMTTSLGAKSVFQPPTQKVICSCVRMTFKFLR